MRSARKYQIVAKEIVAADARGLERREFGDVAGQQIGRPGCRFVALFGQHGDGGPAPPVEAVGRAEEPQPGQPAVAVAVAGAEDAAAVPVPADAAAQIGALDPRRTHQMNGGDIVECDRRPGEARGRLQAEIDILIGIEVGLAEAAHGEVFGAVAGHDRAGLGRHPAGRRGTQRIAGARRRVTGRRPAAA